MPESRTEAELLEALKAESRRADAAEKDRDEARRRLRQNYRRHAEERTLVFGGQVAWCPVCSIMVEGGGPALPTWRCSSGHQVELSTDWKARALAAEAELAAIRGNLQR
jgi:hypothetical protein